MKKSFLINILTTIVVSVSFLLGIKPTAAFIQVNQAIAASYTLEPSTKVVDTYIQPQDMSYGVNVKLYDKNHQLVKNQADFYYQWSIAGSPKHGSTIVYVNDYGMSHNCPYGITAPCPNLHADLRAVKLGQAQIIVEAYKLNKKVAQTSFIVNVTDRWQLDWQTKYPIIQQGVDYPFSIEIKLNGQVVKELDQVRFKWRQATEKKRL